MVDSGLKVSVDPKGWASLKKEADGFDRTIILQLRRALRVVGGRAKDAVVETLNEPAPGGGPDSTGHRAALAAATKVTVSFSGRSAGVKITTSASKLPADNAPFVKAYNLAEFRHPVFESGAQGVNRSFTNGNSRRRKRKLTASGQLAAWVSERGRPYFGTQISKVWNRDAIAEASVALDAALSEITDHRSE